MPDKIDPYREASVVETKTIWPEGLPDMTPAEREDAQQRLHGDPAYAAEVEYVRLHTGFCRQITVTAEDLTRLKQ